MRAWWTSTTLLVAVTSAATADADSRFCGPICSVPGQVVLCNDDLDLTGGAAQANCSASLGSCTGEAFCATFTVPQAMYPITLRKIGGLFAPTAAANAFDLEVYQDVNSPTPGPEITTLVGNTYSIPGDNTAITEIDLIAAGNDYTITSGAFRVCLRKQFDVSHNVCLDTTTAVSRRNWMFAGLALSPPCGDIVGASWQPASFFMLNTDFVIRPTVEVSDLSAWGPGGACTGDPDAGVVDTGPDGGFGFVDTGSPDRGFPDSGVHADAATVDLGFADTGVHPDAMVTGPADSGVFPTPTISAISPSKGANTGATEVVVVGTGFVSGLTLKIGPIPATNIAVPGATTITAFVPGAISPGTYDVVVQNPDGQVALLPQGYQVTGESNNRGSSPPPADGCSCATIPEHRRGSSVLMIVAGCVAIMVGRRSSSRRTRRSARRS